MAGVYEKVPVFENERWILRKTGNEDAKDLFEVYSDQKAVPFFNSDNCDGDTFYYDTMEKMEKAIDFWESSYKGRWFVRWSIIDKVKNKAIGTIELFHRNSTDNFNNTGLLRLDLRSDYEAENTIIDILGLILKDTYESFECDKIATKAFAPATERIKALEILGFAETPNHLVGHDGTEYDSYYITQMELS